MHMLHNLLRLAMTIDGHVSPSIEAIDCDSFRQSVASIMGWLPHVVHTYTLDNRNELENCSYN